MLQSREPRDIFPIIDWDYSRSISIDTYWRTLFVFSFKIWKMFSVLLITECAPHYCVNILEDLIVFHINLRPNPLFHHSAKIHMLFINVSLETVT
jgi:hypothetical protein